MALNTKKVAEAGNYIKDLGIHEVNVVDTDKTEIKNKPGEFRFVFVLTTDKGESINHGMNDNEQGYPWLKAFAVHCGIDVDGQEWTSWDNVAKACVGNRVGINVKAGTPYTDPVSGDLKEGNPQVGSTFKLNK